MHGKLYAKAGKIIAVKEMNAENQLRGSFIMEGEKTNIQIYFTLFSGEPCIDTGISYMGSGEGIRWKVEGVRGKSSHAHGCHPI
jgi:hypothetical protein